MHEDTVILSYQAVVREKEFITRISRSNSRGTKNKFKVLKQLILYVNWFEIEMHKNLVLN